MPVKDQSIYPPYWKQFSLYIRTERSSGKCEECGIANYWLKVVYKLRNGFGGIMDGVVEKLDDPLLKGSQILRTTKIVLTVAHLDAEGDVCRCQDRTGLLCANPNHVKAMCQRCHNRYDVPKRRENRMATAALKNDERRSLFVTA